MFKQKCHLFLALALTLACGVAAAETHDVAVMPVAAVYHTESDIPLIDRAGLKLASHLLPTFDEYRHPAMRSDMRVASAGLVFDRIHKKDTPSGIGWL